jgi:hypothetical protein
MSHSFIAPKSAIAQEKFMFADGAVRSFGDARARFVTAK